MKSLSMTAGALIVTVLGGCASTTPSELKNARNAYQDASQSPGASLTQTDIYEAKKSLDRAEAYYKDEGNDPETRDLAYVAERKAITAKAKGNTAILMRQRNEAIAEAEQWQQQQAVAQRQQLGQTKDQLAQSQQQLESERAARVAAEQRTADALMKMKGMSAKQEARGLVLTLNGAVLFAFGKSDLLPGASKRLDEAIIALKSDPRAITVVGHTDSIGSDDTNMQLSQRRAEAVRTYLISHGIEDGRVTAEGAGKADPIATNKTAEGRANNRRVEIVLNGSAATPTPTPMPGMGGKPSP